jgi:hypothetical protein
VEVRAALDVGEDPQVPAVMDALSPGLQIRGVRLGAGALVAQLT